MAEDNLSKNNAISNLKNLWRREHSVSYLHPSGFNNDNTSSNK